MDRHAKHHLISLLFLKEREALINSSNEAFDVFLRYLGRTRFRDRAPYCSRKGGDTKKCVVLALRLCMLFFILCNNVFSIVWILLLAFSGDWLWIICWEVNIFFKALFQNSTGVTNEICGNITQWFLGSRINSTCLESCLISVLLNLSVPSDSSWWRKGSCLHFFRVYMCR